MCKIYWKNNACTLRHPIDPSKCAYRSQLMNTHIYKLKRLYQIQALCAYGDKAQNFGHRYFPVHALTQIVIILYDIYYI